MNRSIYQSSGSSEQTLRAAAQHSLSYASPSRFESPEFAAYTRGAHVRQPGGGGFMDLFTKVERSAKGKRVLSIEETLLGLEEEVSRLKRQDLSYQTQINELNDQAVDARDDGLTDIAANYLIAKKQMEQQRKENSDRMLSTMSEKIRIQGELQKQRHAKQKAVLIPAYTEAKKLDEDEIGEIEVEHGLALDAFSSSVFDAGVEREEYEVSGQRSEIARELNDLTKTGERKHKKALPVAKQPKLPAHSSSRRIVKFESDILNPAELFPAPRHAVHVPKSKTSRDRATDNLMSTLVVQR